jgi:glycosyltransferase involved in cell wall biosynthesis/GT2 family glycosyltransferase
MAAAIAESPARTAPCDIVVPVFNGHDALARCLDALRRHTPQRHRMLLVDDASTDPRIVPLLRAFAAQRAGARVIENESNLGFVGAVNTALAQSTADVVVLNADTEVTPGWIEGLERCRDSSDAVGVVCPLSNNATLLSVVALDALFAGDAPEAIASCVSRAAKPTYPRIPTAVGFCMLVRRALLDRTGPLDPAYGRGYGEENDLSMRAHDLGFEIACCDDVYVHHAGGASFGDVEALDAARERNHRLLDTRWPAYAPTVSRWMRANPLRPAMERINAQCERERLPGRPRVLHVMHAFDSRGGVEQHTRAMIDALKGEVASNVLVPRGYDAGWSDFAQQRPAPHLRVTRLNRELVTPGIHVLEFRASVRDASVERAVAQFLEGGYDVVHFHSPLSWNTLRLPVIARASGARVALSVHDMGWMCADYNMMGRDGQPCGKSVARGTDNGCVECLRGKSFTLAGGASGGVPDFLEERFAAACAAMEAADAIVCPSQFMVRRLAAAFGDGAARKARLIGHGVHGLAPIYRSAERPVLTVAYVGRFSPQKGGHHFLEAARRLEGQRIVFEAWGAVDERLREMARNLGVKLHGDYSVPDLARHLRGVDLVVIPTPLEESYCLTLDEMHALGIPVAATRRGAIVERISDGENGFLFDAGDVDALARLLLRLRDDRRALAQAAAGIAARRPKTLEENAAEYLALYRSLASLPPHGTDTSSLVPARRLMPLPRRRQRTPLGGDDYDRWLATERLREGNGAPMQVIVMPPDVRALNASIARSSSEWVVLTQAGDRLADDAQAIFAEALRHRPGAALIYGDEDACSVRGERYDPLFKPGFSPELLRHRPYVAGACAIHRDRCIAMGGLRMAGWLGVIDFALRLAAESDPALIAHARGIVVHRLDTNLAELDGSDSRRRVNELIAEAVRRGGGAPLRLAAVGGAPAMWAYQPPTGAPITFYVRCGGVAEDAAACLEAMVPGVAARIAEVIADVDLAHAPALAGVLRKHGCRAPLRAVAKHGGEALVQSFGHASGDWIALVDARLRAFNPGWLERLEQGVSGRFTAGIAPDVTGANGERLPGAWVLGGGAWSVAGPAPAGGSDSALGALYGSPREVSCLSPHLSIWRREAVAAPGITAQLREAGRFDVAQVSLALRERGHDLVARPFVAAQFAPAAPAPAPRSGAETEVPEDAAWMRKRWGARLEHDPLFHPALSLTSPRVAIAPRFPAGPREGVARICAFPFDRWGSGELRVRQPCAALERSGEAQVAMMDTHEQGHAPNGLEWRRLGAATLLAHNFFHDYQLVALDEYAREGSALLVLGMDDLLTDLPAGNPYAATIYPDIAARIARAVSRCHRLVVSTPALADAYGRGIETHVIPNAIDGEVWKGVESRPRGGVRARIGWAGARQHQDDLALLEKVVAVTHREVDWVFLGMCPPSLRRYAAEFHDMVPIADYPAALASLGLDAAVAPLADTAFNRAKSDLKILEYGILRIPVIASSLGEYRHTPVVFADDPDAWIDAVRTLARDRDLAQARGDSLHQWVLTHRTLGKNLPGWLRALDRGRP